jgi:hypothetical protein
MGKNQKKRIVVRKKYKTHQESRLPQKPQMYRQLETCHQFQQNKETEKVFTDTESSYIQYLHPGQLGP